MSIFSEGARHAANRPSPINTPENSPNFGMARRQIGRVNAQIPELSQQLNARYQAYQNLSENDVAIYMPHFVEPTEIVDPVKRKKHRLVKKDGYRMRREIHSHDVVVGSAPNQRGWTIFDTKHAGGGALKLMLGLSGEVFETDAAGVIRESYDISRDLPPSFLYPEIDPLALNAHMLKNHPQNRVLDQNIGTFALAFADIYHKQVVELVANNLT